MRDKPASPGPVPEPSAREIQLEQDIARMETLAGDAQTKGSFGPAVQALSRLATMRGELARLKEEREAACDPDPLRRVQRLIRLASGEGSFIAVERLIKKEAELLAEREAEERRQREAARADAPDEALVDTVVEAVASLPEVLQERFLVRLRLALGRPIEPDEDALEALA